MNWVNSTAARLGLGPPGWLVIAIILAFLFVGSLEFGGSDTDRHNVVLTRRDKWAITTLLGLMASLISLVALREFIG
jgi:hypothetical protein